MNQLQIFDEENGVAAFVVQQIVHQVLGEQDAEASGADTGFGAHLNVLDGGILRIGNGGVRQEIEGEPCSGVVYMNDDGATGVQDGSANPLVRIALAAVLDGVHKQFAEGGGHVFAGLRGEVRGDLAHKVSGAVGGLDLAANVQSDPLRTGGDDADIVHPGAAIERLLHQIGQRPWGDRAVQVAEGALADGVEDFLGSEVAGEDDLGFRPDGTYAAQQLQSVEAIATLGGHHQFDGGVANGVNGFPALSPLRTPAASM